MKIIEGVSRLMIVEEFLFFFEIYGDYGLGFIILFEMRICKWENFCELIKLIEFCLEDIIIVVIGRLMTFVMLFLLYLNIMDCICLYYIMGGVFLFLGNVILVFEVNFYGDLIVVNIVMKYVKNVSIYLLNVI